MDSSTWERHAHPGSVWSRFSVLPLFVLAVWSRVWIGAWAWLPVFLVLLWTWWNPRLFPRPRSTSNWASKVVLGERVWLRREDVGVPHHHEVMASVLVVVSALGLPFLVWGLIRLEFWPVLVGSILVYAGKVWFMDRMVWLYEDMKMEHPDYQQWEY